MMNPYSHTNWLLFRQEIIKLDGGRCVRCSRGPEHGAVLQVHHKAYAPGRPPWEYPYSECETLCKGCHAAEHGIIMPRAGWTHLGTDDLGDLTGNCELCGTEIRYVYAIEHPTWGAMAVGTDCCDKLTGTTDASDYHDRLVKQREKRRRFIDSPRWKAHAAGGMVITRTGIEVRIWPCDGAYRLAMDDTRGKVAYPSVLDAKIRAFDFIESGNAMNFLASRRARLRQRPAQAPQVGAAGLIRTRVVGSAAGDSV